MTSSQDFKSRVDKIFGSLASSRAPTPQNSLWSVTDREVERKEWRRTSDTSERDEMPFSRSFDECLKTEHGNYKRRVKKDLEYDDDDDDDDDDNDNGNCKEDDNQSYREIRGSIGLDKTLDHEEEEDEYDKVAAGRENAGDWLYMSEVTDHGPYLNSHNVLPDSVPQATKDQRANHLAARMRLQEDDAEAQDINPLPSCNTQFTASPVKASTDGDRPKPILKRKNNAGDMRSEKRVRFDPSCSDNIEEVSYPMKDIPTGSLDMDATDANSESISIQKNSRVPDYLLNPSRYTCYSLDSSSEIDEKSNKQACMDFVQLSKSSKPTESEDMSVDLPKSVTFVPKKLRDTKVGDDSNEGKQKQENSKQCSNRSGFPVSVDVMESEHENIDMEEDQPEKVTNSSLSSQKSSRSYRTKSKSEGSDS